MKRRTLLTTTGIAVTLPLAGYLAGDDNPNTGTDDGESTHSNPDSEDDGRKHIQLPCSLEVAIVEEPPEDVSVVSAEETQLLDVAIIERVIEKATSETEFGTAKRRSGEYEQFSVPPESASEFEAARSALEDVPSYDNPDYPPGVYVTTDSIEIVVAITEVCLT